MLAPLTCMSISRQQGATRRGSSAPEAGQISGTKARRSGLDLLLLDHPLDGRTLQHAVPERRVVLELSHRQLTAHTPRVEDEAVRIEHGILFREPLPPRQHAIDLMQIGVEGLKPRLLEGGKGGRVSRIALGSADMG